MSTSKVFQLCFVMVKFWLVKVIKLNGAKISAVQIGLPFLYIQPKKQGQRNSVALNFYKILSV